MIVEKILGNINNVDIENRNTDIALIEWFEVNKKIMKLITVSGMDIGLRLENICGLKYGDIIYMDDEKVVYIDIKECEAISIKVHGMLEMGRACYEIGNRHIPIFLKENEVNVAYDEPIFKHLAKLGFNPEKVTTKLTNGLGNGIHSHEHHH
jgi:Urease accessory protein UreE